jgi:hypothetical protein
LLVPLDAVEENLTYATTKKLLGLETFMDELLQRQQDDVVNSFDVLDQANARNDRRLNLFGFVLTSGLLVVTLTSQRSNLTPPLRLRFKSPHLTPSPRVIDVRSWAS